MKITRRLFARFGAAAPVAAGMMIGAKASTQPMGAIPAPPPFDYPFAAKVGNAIPDPARIAWDAFNKSFRLNSDRRTFDLVRQLRDFGGHAPDANIVALRSVAAQHRVRMAINQTEQLNRSRRSLAHKMGALAGVPADWMTNHYGDED